MNEKPYYLIRMQAGDSTAEVLIFGDIGETWYSESVTAKQFLQDIAALDVQNLTIRINSPGGSVSDGIAIHNAIRRHPANTHVVIESLAASVAGLIAMAGDTVEMAQNALLMVHAPWGVAIGNAVEMRDYANLLDTWATAMSTSYARKTGKPTADMLALLTDGVDHWYTAEEALAMGFVDSIADPLPMAAAIDRAAVVAKFKTLPAKPAATHAAAAAQPAHKETDMPEQKTTAAESQAATDINAAQISAKAEAIAQDKKRRADIKALKTGALVHMSGIDEVILAAADDTDCTLEMAQARILAHLAKNTEALSAGHIVTVEDETDKFRRGVSGALQIRSGLAKNEGANPFRGYTLFELARMSLERGGVKTGHMDKMGIVAAAFTHSTSDFPNLLADVANKSMLKGYDEADETFQRWTSQGVLTDFKPSKRVDLNTFPSLDKVEEGAEYTYATVGDRGETTQLATYGKLFSIHRQAIINDDLAAFTILPRKMGRAAVRSVGNLVYAVLTDNAAMADGVALFHATHANLPTAAAISTDSIDAMITAMAKQTDGSGNTLNIPMAYLLTPIALRGKALVVANSEYEVGAASKNNTTPNWVRGMFEVIADARLDTASAQVWYGAANPMVNDTVEVSYLDGNPLPVLEQQAGWDIDGVSFKVRLDAAVKALDWRGLAKNAGA